MFVQNLLGTHEMYQMVINHLSDGVFLVDRDQNVLVWNAAAARITGYTHEDIVVQGGLSILDHIDRAGTPLAGRGCPINGAFKSGRENVKELFFRHKRGYRIPVLLKIIPICEEDDVGLVMGVFADNSVHVQQSDIVNSLTKLVMTDQLTGLSNRRRTETILETRLQDFRLSGTPFSVLFINLDDFAECNERHGYEVGNRMLVTLAEAFRAAIRETDFIGRWTGEEFVGIFATETAQDLKAVAEKIRVLISRAKMEYEEHLIGVTASIGATMASSGDSAKELVERANSLMHVSKISGKNCTTIG